MKTCGILGGMGVDVTGEMIRRILDATEAKREQDHLPLLINHNPRIPDRTAALLGGGEDALPALTASVAVLARAGADFIAIPCNTAHYYYDAIQAATPVPVLHMLKASVSQCAVVQPGAAVGLLATTGTVRTGLYQGLLADAGLALHVPDEADQDRVMAGIEAIKSRHGLKAARRDMLAVAARLISAGAGVILVGCTDISVVVRDGDLAVPAVDALSVLAELIVRTAREDPS
ncbi:MAG: amino acid racemase [Candidatus Hydrogenedentes bacterium]|nr:amino acid racemase [Candidatus Hydrogenedentota bacterium]